MPNIGFIMMSEGAYKDEEDNIVIYKPITKVTREKGQKEIKYVLSFSLIELEEQVEYEINIVFTSPSGEPFDKSAFSITMIEGNGKNNGFLMINTVDSELEILEDGVYTLEITVGNKEKKILNFYVASESEVIDDE